MDPQSAESVLLLNPGVGDLSVINSTDQLLSMFSPPEEPAQQPVEWQEASVEERERGLRLRIHHNKVLGMVELERPWIRERMGCSMVRTAKARRAGMKNLTSCLPFPFSSASEAGSLAWTWGLPGFSAGSC